MENAKACKICQLLKPNSSFRPKRKTCTPCQRKRNNSKLKQVQPEKSILSRAKQRARIKGIAFEIDISDIIIPLHCPYLGCKLQFSLGRFTYASPSLDRIDNSKGYIKGNVEVISMKANSAKSSMSFEQLRHIAKAVLARVGE